MDDASRLVSELQHKLSELDQRVWQYRIDMASEFTKYAEGLLRDVPKDISEEVSKTIADSLKGYESLNLKSANPTESGVRFLPKGDEYDIGTPSITIPQQSLEAEADGPRSPHEREKEFQGLFTPSYLPLLDSTSRNERMSRPEPHRSLSWDNRGKAKEEAGSVQIDHSADTRSLAASLDLRKPPSPRRQNTDEVSLASDNSDGPVRRSALRRSSSSTKAHSPRRVRFEVAGEEVLPTAAPVLTESDLAADTAPSSLGFGDNWDDEDAAEQVQDNESPPKRISSSQALLALSRSPLQEDGTMWTTVSAPPDGSASVPQINTGLHGPSDDLEITSEDSPLTSEEHRGSLDIPKADARSTGILDTDALTNKGDNIMNNDDAEIPSDDEMLDMLSLKPVRRPKPSPTTDASHTMTSRIDGSKARDAANDPYKKPWLTLKNLAPNPEVGGGEDDLKYVEEDHDGLFHFEDNNPHSSPPEEYHIESESDSPVSPIAEREPVGLSEYSSSPARIIPNRRSETRADAPLKGVVGSYKGHPFSIPIVSDEIHAQAASLGGVFSFVGSLDGRSGLDESDIQSFRASGGVGSFSGTPRSMSERMMMDDLLEAEEMKRTQPH